jgi:hypothetical protein
VTLRFYAFPHDVVDEVDDEIDEEQGRGRYAWPGRD